MESDSSFAQSQIEDLQVRRDDLKAALERVRSRLNRSYDSTVLNESLQTYEATLINEVNSIEDAIFSLSMVTARVLDEELLRQYQAEEATVLAIEHAAVGEGGDQQNDPSQQVMQQVLGDLMENDVDGENMALVYGPAEDTLTGKSNLGRL